MNGIEIAQLAKEQIAQLTGLCPDTISSFARDDDEWKVTVEVIEMKRIPNCTDILATYQAKLDGEGNLLGYERTKRYLRQQAMSEES